MKQQKPYDSSILPFSHSSQNITMIMTYYTRFLRDYEHLYKNDSMHKSFELQRLDNSKVHIEN